MSTHFWKTFRKPLLLVSLGLLSATSPTWAATRSPKGTVKLAGTDATCSTGTSCASADPNQVTEVDRKLGTAVTWMQSPDDAAKAATDDDKLVFMIQVSGNFARQEFT